MATVATLRDLVSALVDSAADSARTLERKSQHGEFL